MARTGLGAALLIVFGGVSTGLAVRALPGAGDAPGQLAATGDLSPHAFDYLIWTSLGAIMLGVAIMGIGLVLGIR